MEYKPTNREKSKKRKSGNAYCGGCDRALIPDWSKCPICGWRKNRKKLKKY